VNEQIFIDVFSRKFDGIHESLNSGNKEPKQSKKKNLLIFFDESIAEEPTKVEPVVDQVKKIEPIKETQRVPEKSSIDQSKRERRNSKLMMTEDASNVVKPQIQTTEKSSEMMISFDFFDKSETPQTNLNNGMISPKSGVISPNSGSISPNSMGSVGKMNTRSNSMIPNKNPMINNSSMGQNRTMNQSNAPFEFGSQYTLPTMVFQSATPIQSPNPQVFSPQPSVAKKEPENTQKKEKDPFSDLFWK
jgi:hypothetical protein